MMVAHHQQEPSMIKIAKFILYSLLFCLVNSTYAMLLPTTNTTNSTTNNASNTALSQMINSRTQQANKAFDNVNYKKMAGDNKDSFFDNGGMGDIGGDLQFKNFRTHTDAAETN